MKILYLTGDTTIRASAFSLFLPLYRELKSIGVDIKEIDALNVYGDGYKKNIFEKNGDKSIVFKQLDADKTNSEYDIVVLENPFPYWNEEWNRITKPKKVLILGDLHRFNPTTGKYTHFMSEIVNRIGIDAIFTKYIETYNRDYKSINLPVYHWPHSVDPNTFYDYKLKKKYGVLSTGMMSKVYPLRRQVHKELKNKKYYKRIDRPKNRTDKYPDPWPVGKDYAKEINKARISVACTSIYHYTIAKIFEIPAAGSVLLCDYTKEMKSLGFIPDHNFLKIPKNNITGYVQTMLDNTTKLEQIRKNGYEMVHERHNVKRRVEEFEKYCKELL